MEKISEIDLPKPPIPQLSDTLQRFLQIIKVTVTNDQYKHAEKLIGEFQDKGEKLQQLLTEYADNTDNYVTKFWLNNKYLRNPLPLPVHSSPFFLLPKQIFSKNFDRFNYIAKFIVFSLIFKEKLDSQNMKRDIATGLAKGNLLSMATYYNFFNSYRRPGAYIDEHIVIENNRHIIVACNNQFFALRFSDETSLPSEKSLREKLEEIENQSKLKPNCKPIGILTADNRPSWAVVRERIKKDKINKTSINCIENCLFIVCMDESLESKKTKRVHTDQTSEFMAQHILHGTKIKHSAGNRWFDKFLQFIVTKNGVNGICIENSLSDGNTVLRFCGEFLEFLKIDHHESQSDVQLTVDRLEWNIDESIIENITKATFVNDLIIKSVDLHIMNFSEFGKKFINKHMFTPSVFIQLGLQLTYFRMYQKLTSSYEAADLRKFKFGRAGNIRACTEETLEFARSVLDVSQTWADKWLKFRKAVLKHREIFNYTINGEDPDNHLICLREIATLNNLQEPALFQTDFYREFINFRLITHRLRNKYNIIVGYGAVVPDGYVCTYNHEENCIIFCISSNKSNKMTDSKNFAKNLKMSLLNLKELCEKSNSEVASGSV